MPVVAAGGLGVNQGIGVNSGVSAMRGIVVVNRVKKWGYLKPLW